jgi:hypothetical protein
VNYAPSGVESAGFYKDIFGIVHLKGYINSGTASVVFTLPAGYRPSEEKFFPSIDSSGSGQMAWVAIEADGRLVAPSSDACCVQHTLRRDHVSGRLGSLKSHGRREASWLALSSSPGPKGCSRAPRGRPDRRFSVRFALPGARQSPIPCCLSQAAIVMPTCSSLWAIARSDGRRRGARPADRPYFFMGGEARPRRAVVTVVTGPRRFVGGETFFGGQVD